MLKFLPTEEESPDELRDIVQIAVRLLGDVIRAHTGSAFFLKIESLRQRMTELRNHDEASTLQALRVSMRELEKLKPADRLVVARSFTLMLELINTCENAYRSHRFSLRRQENPDEQWKGAEKSKSLVYVLTAHPTEARSAENVAVFRLIQDALIRFLGREKSTAAFERELSHLLQLAWRTFITRREAPAVSDEADQIYSILLERKILDSLLEASHEILPVYVRSWVGGDKDGHNGVDEKVLLQSLSLSRKRLLDYLFWHLGEVKVTLDHLNLSLPQGEPAKVIRDARKLLKLKPGDGARIEALRLRLHKMIKLYQKRIGALHPSFLQIQRLLHVFPALVVPLEVREASDVLMSDPETKKNLAIDRMLRTLASVAGGGDPRWYARGFIISMAGSLDHLRVATRKVKKAFGGARIPVIPLFEQATALKEAPEIVRAWVNDKELGPDFQREWNRSCEMMIGYSDSSKESGVLFSRLTIAESMHELEEVCEKMGINPIFFQGSGGSVDRGGGRVQDQIAWWPKSALKIYKVTIQGEMVERSLASPEITRSQILRIAQSASETLAHVAHRPHVASLDDFARRVRQAYQEMIHDENFLNIIEKGTPYTSLGELKIGSRPVRRVGKVAVSNLRAIPWILCWTQTRVMFPTWWGVGTAWTEAGVETRKSLRKAFHDEPVFSSYIRALGFTVAKMELEVWRLYLEQSELDSENVDEVYARFVKEREGVLDMLKDLSGEENPLWFNLWLGASIRLRAPMVHPLNLLQILALQDKDYELLRVTVTGISSGMLNTG